MAPSAACVFCDTLVELVSFPFAPDGEPGPSEARDEPAWPGAGDAPSGDVPVLRLEERQRVNWCSTLWREGDPTMHRVIVGNISSQGLFLRTDLPLRVAEELELELELPDQLRLQMRATVRHIVSKMGPDGSDIPSGIGVELDALFHPQMMLVIQIVRLQREAAKMRASLEAIRGECAAWDAQKEESPWLAYDVEGFIDADGVPTDVPGSPSPNLPISADRDPRPSEASAPAPSPATNAPAVVVGTPSPADEFSDDSGRVPLQAEPANTPSPARRSRGLSHDIAGIDFGVSYSGLAMQRGEKVVLATDTVGRQRFPSVVHFPESGPPLVGWDARDKLAEAPDRTFRSAKRILGRTFADPTVSGFLHNSGFMAHAGPNDAILIEVDGDELTVPQICAQVLEYLKSTAENNTGAPLRKAVLTHPVSFGRRELSGLQLAAKLAGLEVAGLLPEPIAAALAYGYGQKNELIAVYDFGGGTFDFTLVDFSMDQYRVLASSGDAWLGGDDFDLALSKALANSFWRETKVELQRDMVHWQRLLLASEKAKQELSSRASTTLVLAELGARARGKELRRMIDRSVMERITKPLFERSLACCQEALDEVGLEPQDVNELVITGGTSQIPFIRAGLEAFFECEVKEHVSPEEAVVRGASVYAGQIARGEVDAVLSGE